MGVARRGWVWLGVVGRGWSVVARCGRAWLDVVGRGWLGAWFW